MIHSRIAETSTETDSTDDDPYHHGDLKHTLIAAALDLLAEKQDWGFSLREVARRAGVSHNAPYNHFNSRQDLLASVAAAGYDLLRARMQDAIAQGEAPSAALKAAGAAYVRFGVENPAHYRLMFGTVLTTAANCLPSAVGESAAAAKELLSGIIRQGAEKGSFALSPTDTEALNMAVLSAWSLVHGLTALLIDGLAGAGTMPDPFAAPAAEQAAERIAEHVTQLLLDGMNRKNVSQQSETAS